VTAIRIIVRDPERAAAAARVPNEGAGPCPVESIIRERIQAHPMALLHPGRVEDPAARALVEDLAAGHGSGAEFFVSTLAEGMAQYARAFAPAPVVVRLSDFDSAAYAGLAGGAWFEPTERNPMIGLRGAARYVHPVYREAFELECEAVRRARGGEGLTNLEPLIPYCRTVAEAEAVLRAMADNGLGRGVGGLRVHLMCEVPNNVVLMDRFAPLFDGVSIGTLDLAQSVLGIDRDSAAGVASFDECDPGVLRMLEWAIEGARRHGTHTSVCGQAPSDHREVVVRAVVAGVDAIGVRADAAARVAGWLAADG
jgi:pyruvate,water dikinase